MIKTLHAIPYYRYKVNDWQQKKELFKQVLDTTTYVRSTSDEFDSDRESPRAYVDDFIKLFSDELSAFGMDIKVQHFRIKDIWSVQYQKGDYHVVHTHGISNFSGVLYFDYDREVHTPTYFVADHINPITGYTDIITEDVDEGEIVIFPSNMLHFTKPNKSDKIRTIVSFDIELD